MAPAEANVQVQTNGTKSAKNILELDPEEWLRGETLSNVEQRCLDLCSQFIGGSWVQATNAEKDLEVKRIAGGLTNQIYKVALKDHVKTVPNPIYEDEPRAVAIKFYQPKHFQTVDGKDERLSDTIILLIASQLSIGTRIYGFFDNGVIQHFYKHKPFLVEEQRNERLLRKLMHNLATINLLKVPISKSCSTYNKFIKNGITAAFEELNIREKIKEYGFETLNKYDVQEEYAEFEKIMRTVPNPVVFCHNDFRSANILVTGEDPERQELVLCDFEYGGYGLRGRDFATLLMEWDMDKFNMEHWNNWTIPKREVLEKVVGYYLEGCDSIKPGYSSQPGNSVDHIIRDIKIGFYDTLMFFISFLINTRESFATAVEFDVRENLNMVESTYLIYHRVKKQLLDEGLIQIPLN